MECSPCDAEEGFSSKTGVNLLQINMLLLASSASGDRTRVLGCRLPVLHGGRALRRRGAGLSGDGFVAAVLRAGWIGEGVLGGVGVGEYHHLAVLTALCQDGKHKRHQ